MSPDPKWYLDYLDKEMTIMGLLSAFSVALASFATDRIVSADRGVLSELWRTSSECVLIGAGSAVLASFLFYKQRAHLAWFYGQIALERSRARNLEEGADAIDVWLTRADGWDTWLNYQGAFVALFFSFASYAYGLARALNPWVRSMSPVAIFSLALILTLSVMAVRWHALTRFPQSKQPLRAYRRWMVLRLRHCRGRVVD